MTVSYPASNASSLEKFANMASQKSEDHPRDPQGVAAKLLDARLKRGCLLLLGMALMRQQQHSRFSLLVTTPLLFPH